MDTRTERTTGEGKICVAINESNAVIVEIRTETDFTARNENFVEAVEKILHWGKQIGVLSYDASNDNQTYIDVDDKVDMSIDIGRTLIEFKRITLDRNTSLYAIVQDELPEALVFIASNFSIEDYDQAEIVFNYSGMNIDEDKLAVYRCVEWDFAGKMCRGEWRKLINYKIDKPDKIVTAYVPSFSAYKLVEEEAEEEAHTPRRIIASVRVGFSKK